MASPPKTRTCSYGNLQKKVTRLTAAGSGHAFSFQTDTLAGINTCRNMNLKCLRCTGASVRAGQRNPFICTKSGLIEGNVDAGLHIGAFLREILLMESAKAAATVKSASSKAVVESATVTGEVLISAVSAKAMACAVTAVEHISKDITKDTTKDTKDTTTPHSTQIPLEHLCEGYEGPIDRSQLQRAL